MIILIFLPQFHTFERYQLELFEPMPYTHSYALSVSAFRGNSRSSVLWTTKPAMEFWMSVWKRAPNLIPCHAFCRIGEGKHICFSKHYTGEAFDIPYPIGTTFEKHCNAYHISETPSTQFPPIKFGCSNIYVLILQDALMTLGFDCAAIDGYWGKHTESAIRDFSRATSTSYSGEITPLLWKRLLFRASGCGIKKYIEM